MDYGRSPSGDDEQCIDPRLLLAGSGGGVDDPHYNLPARPPITDDEFDLEQGINTNIDVFIESAPIATAGNGTHGIQDAQDFLRPRPPWTLDPKAAAFVPKRPQLKLDTDVTPNEPPTGTTPTTPEIRVSAPGGTASVHDGVGTWQTGLERRRARRNSSPARRYAHQSGRIARLGQAYLSPGTSPSSMEIFVTQHAYHAGDRTANRSQDSPFYSPRSVPRNVPRAPSTVSSNLRRNSSGQYSCDFPDCTETQKGKAFDTPNELRKHKRKHIPERDRPHGCDLCTRRFLFPKDLTRHKKTHESFTEGQEDDRPRCPVCQKPLSRDDNLSRHLLQIHGLSTPSSSGRGQRHTEFGSPSPESTRSLSVYSGSRPASRIGPIPETNARLQQILHNSQMMDDPFTNLPFIPDSMSPVLAPSMARSQSDIH